MKTLTIILITLILFACNEKRITDNTKESKEINNVGMQPIAFGKITTIADGFDVKKVKLWSSTSTNRKVLAFMTNGEKIKVLQDSDPYYLVESVNGAGRKGYCMKGFVIIDD